MPESGILCLQFKLISFTPESRALIVGSEDLYIHEGSPVKLQCRVVDSAGPPAYIYWYKGKEVINYSNLKHIEISYSSLKINPVSTLVIKVHYFSIHVLNRFTFTIIFIWKYFEIRNKR